MTAPTDQLTGLIDQLREVLEEERRALLSGTSEAINTVAQRKLLLAERIEQATAATAAPRPGAAELVALARYNQENAVICDTMLRHLTAAIDRLRRQDPHRSYKPDGSEQSQSAKHVLGAA
jgi:flagellar biosynthesis/type III secretory pathway chaperone